MIMNVASESLSIFPDMEIESPAKFGGKSFTYMSVENPAALNLDGSRYGIAVCLSSTSKANWTFSTDGGGWCYDEADCFARASTTLGSNKTWPGEAAAMGCDPATTSNYARLFYGDGASRSGYREEAWPVPGNASQVMYFRGAASFDSALDLLLKLGMSQAELIVFTGGSAGGLTVFLHLDHVAERMKTEAPNARVVGEPVCGFFLDSSNDGYAPPNVTYTLQMQYVYNMQAAGASLSPQCQAHWGKDAWKCIMAPYAAPYITTPWFALQSRFDKWQLGEELFMPCMQRQSYSPPWKPNTCTAADEANIRAYGPRFMSQFRPLMDTPGTKNGAFLDACIIHGSTNSKIDGVTNSEAFQQWLAGGKAWYTMLCGGSDEAGPCDSGNLCAPF